MIGCVSSEVYDIGIGYHDVSIDERVLNTIVDERVLNTIYR